MREIQLYTVIEERKLAAVGEREKEIKKERKGKRYIIRRDTQENVGAIYIYIHIFYILVEIM